MERWIRTSLIFEINIDAVEEFLGKKFDDDDEAEEYALKIFYDEVLDYHRDNNLENLVAVEWL